MGKGGYMGCCVEAQEALEKFEAECEKGMHVCLFSGKQSAQQKGRFYTTRCGPMEPHMEDWTTPHVVGKRGFYSPECMVQWYSTRNRQTAGGRMAMSSPAIVLNNDINRVAAVLHGTPLSLRIRTAQGTSDITVDAAQQVVSSIRQAIGTSANIEVHVGGVSITEGTFEENAIYEDSLLHVVSSRSQFDVVVEDILELHAGSETVTREALTKCVHFDEEGKLQSWVLSGLGLTNLPESMGQLEFGQDLWLTDNQLTTLPDSLKNSNKLGGKVWLMRNRLPNSYEYQESLKRDTDHWDNKKFNLDDPDKAECDY